AKGRQFDGVEVSAAKLLFDRDEAPGTGEGEGANRGKRS
ncbi:MAG: hypothetical protein RIT45_3286, partial [Pseudomonadota bacterium]